MKKIKNQRSAVEKLEPIPLKILEVIIVSLIFMIGLSACGTVKSFTGPAESKNLYQDNKPSIADVQLSPKVTEPISVDRLKQSDWWTKAQKNIKESEYHVRYHDKTHLPGLKGAFHASNRSQNLRAYFTANGVRVIRRTEKNPTWTVGLKLAGAGAGDNIIALEEDKDPVVDGARIEYHRGQVVEWYENKPEGLEQGFTVKEKMEGEGPLSLVIHISGDIKPVVSDNDGAVDFLTSDNIRVLRYGKLKAFDAKGHTLKNHLQVAGNTIKIVIADSNAVYPISVDPLLTSPSWTAESNQGGARFGVSVGTAGDVNNDGYDDVIVGAHAYDNGQTYAGKAYVYHGSVSGLSTTAAWTAEGNQESAYFGMSVGTAGDVNNDGYDDVIVGAESYTNNQTNDGSAYVYHGSGSGLSNTAAWTAEGTQNGAGFGHSVGTAGDVNGDGYDDVIVAANGQNGYPSLVNAGRAYVYHGSVSGLSTTAAWTADGNQADAIFGTSVGTAGDVNNDGYDDVIVGAYRYDNGLYREGAAFVWHGSASGLGPAGTPGNAAWTAEGNQASAYFGISVGTAGDVDGDGYDDVIVGAHYYDNDQTSEGRAYVYHGSVSGLSTTAAWTAESDQTNVYFGFSVGTAGDVNNDGYDDVVVGAFYYDNGQTDEGAAFMWHGSASGLGPAGTPGNAAWTAEGNQASADFGISVGTAGDVDGDGYDDVIVGAYFYDNVPDDEGAAFVYRGVWSTAVLLTSFRAYEAGGEVVVEWETASEIGTVGFYLLRLDEETGKYLKVNNKLLPGLLHSLQGGVYRYVDETVESAGTYTYKLMEVEVKGRKRTYGPFTFTVGGEGIGGSAGILAQSGTEIPVSGFSKKAHKKSAAKKLRIESRESAMATAAVELIVSDTVKIAVNQSGLYYVDASEIAAVMGETTDVVADWIKSKKLILKNQGQMVAWLAAAGNVGIYFYGEAIDSIYTNENIYSLKKGKAGAGFAMQVVEGEEPYPGGGYETFTETIHIEEDHYPLTGLFDDPQADYWLWDYIFADDPYKTFHISADGVAGAGTVTLKVHLQGATDTDSAQDHHVQVSLNGIDIGEGYWDGASAYELVCTFDHGFLYEGDNTIEVTGLLGPGAPHSLFYVDSFDLTYQRYYEAVNNKLFARGDGNHVITIEDFTSEDIYVFEVGDPKKPELIAATTIDNGASDGSNRVSFTPANPDESYLALTLDAASTPVSVTPDTPSKLKRKTNQANYLVIAPSELEEPAERLAGYRQGKLDTMVVELQDIYDEFNYGFSNPEAIRDFLSYAYRKWKKAPRYVVLAGVGTLDYKDNQGYGDNLLPPLLVATPYGLFPSDNRFVDVEGDDGVPEMAIGRLPVVTSLELDALIDKIITYESTGGSWRDRVLMLADDPDNGGEFPADSDVVATLLPPQYTAERIYLSEHTTGKARQLVQNGINAGALLLNYIGHAGVDRLSQEGMLLSSDMDTLANGYKLPVVTAMTCVAGQFAIPGYDALGELLVLHEGGGAIAAWAPTGLSLNELAVILDKGFFRAAFQDEENILGDIVLRALEDYAWAGKPRFMLDIYNLLGDPALQMW